MKPNIIFTIFLSIFLIAGFTIAKSNSAKVKTVQNIKDAIIGETTASTKYAAYAKKAREEGYDNIALLFEAASKSENIHAGNHRAALEQLGEKMDNFTPKYEVKTTKVNLQDAINGESYEVSTMYPEFIKTANEAGINIALLSFNYAYQTEKKHKVFYKNALEMLENGKQNELPSKYFVCTTCGNTYDNNAPTRCGISMTPKERFITID
jgi:rubrerythrin